MEQWKKIKGYERYEVSDKGIIRAIITRRQIKPQGRCKSKYVRLSGEGITQKRYVSAIVAETFGLSLTGRWYTIEEYDGICRDITEKSIICDNINTEGRGFKDMHIDHIIPVFWGWKNNISPHLIGMSANLNMLHWRINYMKGSRYKLLN